MQKRLRENLSVVLEINLKQSIDKLIKNKKSLPT